MKIVLVVDDGVKGHKYAFNKLFVKYLLRLDFKVVLALPEKGKMIKGELQLEENFSSENLIIHDFSLPRPSRFSLDRRVRNVIKALNKWLALKSLIGKVEEKNQLSIDYVFISMLDSYLTNYLPPLFVDILIRKKWAGLYFHPWYLFNIQGHRVNLSSVDSALRSKNCIAIGIHDEQLIKPLEKRIPKKILYFPEIADFSPPQKNNAISNEIMVKSKRRPVVGVVGLARRKNVLLLLDVIENQDVNNDFFYFISGSKPPGDYTKEEEDRIDNLFANPPENVLAIPGHIPEGAEMNAVISAFDMLFLVYQNFKSSSNLLTKAVLFKKPTLGCWSYWIGENIRTYNLGVNLKGDDSEEVFDKMQEVKTSIVDANWQGFLEKNDESNLHKVFSKIFLRH